MPPLPATLALPDRPSIAVLPFDNMTSDPDQDYFVDGIAEDLITALSRFQELFGIALNSTFVFKCKPVDVKKVGRGLGVQYVVEGSLRRTGNRVRVRAFRSSCASMGAWESYQRGLWHVYRYRPKDIAAAKQFFECAIAADPHFAPAHAGQAYALYAEAIWGFVTDVSAILQKARQLAQRAVALDARDAQRKPHCTAWAHLHVASALANLGRLDEARAAMDRAPALQPDISLRWVRALLPTEPGVNVDAYFEGMKRAGLKVVPG